MGVQDIDIFGDDGFGGCVVVLCGMVDEREKGNRNLHISEC